MDKLGKIINFFIKVFNEKFVSFQNVNNVEKKEVRTKNLVSLESFEMINYQIIFILSYLNILKIGILKLEVIDDFTIKLISDYNGWDGTDYDEELDKFTYIWKIEEDPKFNNIPFYSKLYDFIKLILENQIMDYDRFKIKEPELINLFDGFGWSNEDTVEVLDYILNLNIIEVDRKNLNTKINELFLKMYL